jgi:hypothetical protein
VKFSEKLMNIDFIKLAPFVWKQWKAENLKA